MDEIRKKQLDYLRQVFDLDNVYTFRINHQVEVLIQDDLQYHCFINYCEGDGAYSIDIDPLSALVNGINNFRLRS